LGQIVKVHPDPYLACSQAHAVLVVTDCDQFRNAPASKSSKQSIIPPMQKELARSTADEMGEENSKRACARQDQEIWTHAGVSYQLRPQEACSADCGDCRSAATRPTATEAIEWTRIAYNMVEPKWVFDGRGILDAVELERLGVSVDVVGRRTQELVA
jgi:UDPglucose 6-dehydrogenase